MPKNLDTLREQLKSTSTALAAAMTAGDEAKITACLEEYGKAYNEYHNDGMLEQISEQLDKSVLTARGRRFPAFRLHCLRLSSIQLSTICALSILCLTM